MLANINNVCRLCMAHENVLLPIFWDVETKFSSGIPAQLDLCSKITSFAAIEISENDGLPSRICQQCVIEVNRSYNFKKQCENTDATLRQCFMTLHSNGENYQKMDIKDVRMNENYSSFSKQRPFNTDSESGSQKLIVNHDLKSDEIDTHYNHGVSLQMADCEDRGSAGMEVETLYNVEQGNALQQNSNEDDVTMGSDDERMTILEPVETEKLNIPLMQVINVNGKRFHQCLVCSKRFGHKSHLTDHVRIHTREKTFHCYICNKYYAQKSSFGYHQALHNGEKPHACFYCDKSFFHKSHLINHMRLHTWEKPYSCNVCGKEFSLHSSLRSHLSHHIGNKPFICTICNKTYSKKSSLTSHLELHKPQKSHGCTYCNKKFIHKSDLKVHVRIHTGDRPYTCSECGKRFSFKSSLASHSLHHTEEMSFSCQICDEGCSKQSSHNLHLHNGEKPHQCCFCGRLFSHKSHLTNHMRLHTVEKPFLCSLCGHAFTTESALTVHYKTSHRLKDRKTYVSQNK